MRRYVASLLAVERLRAGAWWDATLRPLRRREAAPRAAAAAALSVARLLCGSALIPRKHRGRKWTLQRERSIVHALPHVLRALDLVRDSVFHSVSPVQLCCALQNAHLLCSGTDDCLSGDHCSCSPVRSTFRCRAISGTTFRPR